MASFQHLGMIPIEHVYARLRTSLALINPLRCQGWNTAALGEAKSFDVPMILCDIDVHREQAGGAARYFGVDDASAFAEFMVDISMRGRLLSFEICSRVSMTRFGCSSRTSSDLSARRCTMRAHIGVRRIESKWILDP